MNYKELKVNPNNPRYINEKEFERLKKSIAEFPEMLELRPIIYNEENIILGGNQRYRAVSQLIEEGKIVEKSEYFRSVTTLTEEQQKEFVIRDNVADGSWDFDILANEWGDVSLNDWGVNVPSWNDVEPWTAEKQEEVYADPSGDGVDIKAGYRLGSMWYGMSSVNEVRQYMLDLPANMHAKAGATVGLNYSRTNAEETERIVKTYMREGDVFFEMCCGWMTFSSTAKYYGYSGKGGDIWDESIEFCKRQIMAMPGNGKVEVLNADCRDTKEPSDTYDFVHSNPPFFSLEEYSNNENDLAKSGSYDGWLSAMAEMGTEAERILKSGGLANFVINDFREKGVVKTMHSDFIEAIQRSSGLVLHDLVVAEVISQALRFRKHDYEKRRTVKCHEYVITFKKLAD